MAKKEGILTETEKVEIESKKELIDSIPKVIVYGGIAVMVWFFTLFIFAPLGNSYTVWGVNAGKLVAFIGTLAMILLIVKVLKEIKDVGDAIGGLVATKVGRDGASPEEVNHWRTAIRGLLYVIMAAIIFTFFASLLSFIHQTLAGIVLLIVFIWVIFMLYRSGMAISHEIEAYAHEQSEKLLKEAAKD